MAPRQTADILRCDAKGVCTMHRTGHEYTPLVFMYGVGKCEKAGVRYPKNFGKDL